MSDSTPVAGAPHQVFKQAHAILGYGEAIGPAQDPRFEQLAVYDRRMKLHQARTPAQFRLFATNRQVDRLKAVRYRVLECLGDRGGHDTVARPGGVEPRIIQIDAVAHGEADARGDNFIADAKLEHPD